MALFERISLLIVQDDAYVCRLMRQVLFNAGFRLVRTVRSGTEAIGQLSALRRARFGGGLGVQGIDIVFSEAYMPGINGVDLLRWIRQDPNSPNRFMPFIMVTGEADEDLVYGCRDVGMSEMVAKPFSLATLLQKITHVIERPRQFVLNRAYFGPDRRRQKGEWSGRERRGMHQVRRFSSEQTNLNVMRGQTWLFDLPNRLKPKLEVDPSLAGMPVDYSADLVKAEAALASAENETRDYVLQAGNRMEQAFQALVKNPAEKQQALAEIAQVARELRGHGGTFGYPLVSQFARSLHIFTESVQDINEDVGDLLKAHIDVIKIVVRQNAKMESDPIAVEIKGVMGKAMDKYTRRRGQAGLDKLFGTGAKVPSAA
ncbi:MAG: response regulator [Alphaproteobacteria bacterium]|nr:response regulator [Alphaproteobacteria bacterium]